jgi:hypothetical protein
MVGATSPRYDTHKRRCTCRSAHACRYVTSSKCVYICITTLDKTPQPCTTQPASTMPDCTSHTCNRCHCTALVNSIPPCSVYLKLLLFVVQADAMTWYGCHACGMQPGACCSSHSTLHATPTTRNAW